MRSIIFTLLAILPFLINGQQDQFINCTFIERPRYTCIINNAFVYTENRPVNFIGNHIANFNDSHVAELSILYNSNVTLEVLSRDVVNYFPNLNRIVFWEAAILRIPFDAFQRCENFEAIEILFNNISGPLSGVFRNCRNLKILSLTGNRMGTLNSGTFSGLNNLETLAIGSNRLYELSDDIFNDLRNLQTLDLSFNEFRNFNDKIFAPLINLRSFSAFYCRLDIHPNAFNSLTELTFLNFENNFLTFLPDGLFNNLTNLQVFSVGWNRFRRFSSEPFGLHVNTTNFSIRNNQIHEIDPRIFDKFPNLAWMDGNNNLCINQTVNDVASIDFGNENVFDDCIYNFFHPTESGSGKNDFLISIFGILILMRIFDLK